MRKALRTLNRVGRAACPVGACLLLVLGAQTVLADPELPGPAPSMELVPAGSLVIPMDNAKQNVGSPFNLKAYGLVNKLLWDEIPVKWAIAAGKAKDAADFTATAQRVLPTAIPAALLSFSGGPFIVPADWAGYARQKMAEYGNQVAVYELTTDVTIDIRYTILQKRRVGALDDGGNAGIHIDALVEAGFDPSHYLVIPTASLVTVNSASCYTVVTEAHWDGSAPTSDGQVQAVRDFVTSGGNFLAQCEGIAAYENNPTYGLFQSTLGIVENNLGETFLYPDPDLPYGQFDGPLATGGGSIHDFRLLPGSVLQNNAHPQVQDTPTTDSYAATGAKLVPGGNGSLVFYLGGHSYDNNSIEEINGLRLYMNAVMIPSFRPDCDNLNFVDDPSALRTLSGRVLEDLNGDSNLVDAVGVSGVRVRLYADSNGNGLVDAGDSFMSEVATEASGNYSFQVLPSDSGNLYLVAVDSKTLIPDAGFNLGSGSGDVWAQQTYGDNSSTRPLDLGSRYGGRTPGVSDDVDPLSTDPANSNYQHLARVDLSAGDVAGVDFAFSFNVVTNTRGGDIGDDDSSANRTIQGTLRQFIDNANATQGSNAMRFVPAVSTNASSGPHSWWSITISEELPAIVDSGTTVDGTAYQASNGVSPRNDNSTGLGSGGTVGTDGLPLVQLDPELEIIPDGGERLGIDVQANSTTVRGLATYGFGDKVANDKATIRVGDVTGTLIEFNVLGTSAASFSDPASGSKADLIRIVGGDSGTIRDNLVGFSGGNGIGCAPNSNGWLVQGNEIRGNATADDKWAGVNLADSSTATVRGNLIWENLGAGVETLNSTGSHTLENNTVRRNGLGETITPGIRLFGTGSTVDRNVLSENYGAGVLVTDASRFNSITRNSIFDNGTVPGSGGGGPTGQIGIDLLSGSDDENTGDPPYVTANDGNDGDAGGNDLLNFPVLASAVSSAGGTMVVGTYDGLATATFTLEFFSSPAADPSGFGEGRSFLGDGQVTTDGSGSAAFVFTFGTAVPLGNVISATATGPAANTSEFSGAVAVTTAHGVSGNVYHDADTSGTFDVGETGIGEAWVKLLVAGTVVDIVQADFDTGAYSFPAVADGTYTVIVDDNDQTSDTTPTEPVGWMFLTPASGAQGTTVSGGDETGVDFGLEFNPGTDCSCGFEDGQFTQQAITIDGDMAEWAAVLADGDNNSCDAADATDRDFPVQSTGRNLLRVAATWDSTHFSMWTQRVGQANNTQNFIYYADANTDDVMSFGEPVVVAKWQGNTGAVDLELHTYDDLGSGGDPMLDGMGYADGYSLPGDLNFVKDLPVGSAMGSTSGPTNGTQMEWKILWTDLGLSPGAALGWHVGSTNSNPGSAGLGAQIDDNLGGCGSQCSGSSQFGGVDLTPVGATSGTTVYAAHLLTNTGNGSDVFDLTWTSTGDFVPGSVQFYQDLGTVGQFDSGVDVLLADTDGDPDPDTGTLVAGATFDLLVAIELPASPPAAAADVTTTATSNFFPSCGGGSSAAEDSVTDSVEIPRQLVKRAFQVDGTAIPDGSSVPQGMPVLFLAYIDNPGGAVSDVTLQDLLDSAFGYVPGSIKVDQSLDSAVVCPGGSCDESAILAQVDSAPAVCGTTGNECTDTPDVDPVSFSGSTVHAGDGNEPGNAQLDVPAGKVLALLFQVLIQ